MPRTFDATFEQWLDEPSGPLKPVDVQNMRTGTLVQHGKPTDVVSLANLAEKIKAVAR